MVRRGGDHNAHLKSALVEDAISGKEHHAHTHSLTSLCTAIIKVLNTGNRGEAGEFFSALEQRVRTEVVRRVPAHAELRKMAAAHLGPLPRYCKTTEHVNGCHDYLYTNKFQDVVLGISERGKQHFDRTLTNSHRPILQGVCAALCGVPTLLQITRTG